MPPRRLRLEKAFQSLKEFLVNCHDYRDPIADEIYCLSEPQSLQHLFKVACGLDSMVRARLKFWATQKSFMRRPPSWPYRHSPEQRLSSGLSTSPNKSAVKPIFSEAAFRLGRSRWSWQKKIFTRLQNREIMIVGAGDTGEKNARALLSRGARHLWFPTGPTKRRDSGGGIGGPGRPLRKLARRVSKSGYRDQQHFGRTLPARSRQTRANDETAAQPSHAIDRHRGSSQIEPKSLSGECLSVQY